MKSLLYFRAVPGLLSEEDGGADWIIAGMPHLHDAQREQVPHWKKGSR